MSLLIFNRGQFLTPDNLFINVRAANGDLIDPADNGGFINYSIFDNTTGTPILIPPAGQTPIRVSTGKYYAPYVIPLNANLGDWLVVWNLQETSLSPIVNAEQPFVVAPADFIVGPYASLLINPIIPNNENIIKLIYRLRIHLRDNNPDRNYHFLPPTPEREIQGYTKKFRFIWEDYELYEYLYASAHRINAYPPATGYSLIGFPVMWETVLLDGAKIYAFQALTANWIADEFNYSISGVSLDIEKSSKYESLKQNLEQEFEKQVEKAKATVKIIKGLKQPRYGLGVSSTLGPFTSKGTVSASAYIFPGRG